MMKYLSLGPLVLLGGILLVGCGVSGHLSATPTGNGIYNVSGTVLTSGVPTPSTPSHPTLASNSSKSSSTTSTSSSTSAPQSSTSSNVVTIRNLSTAQIAEKINQGEIYGVADSQPNAPGQVVVLTAKQLLATPPTTLNHWPPQRFNVVAVFTDPENQFGATPWINGLSHEVHWLHTTPGLSISTPSTTNSTSGFNSVAIQAFQAIRGHTQTVMGGPTKLPPSQGGYLTAQTQATQISWHIQLLETTQPYAVNSPSISLNNVVGGTAEWGVTMLPSVPSNASQAVETSNSLWKAQAVINQNATHQSTQVGTAQYGRPAILYPVSGNQWTNTKLVFTEGEWTIELVGSNAQSEEQTAYTIANNLHFQSLPPDPGLMIVDMTVPFSSQSVSLAAAITTLDWVKGSTVFWVSASQASNNNPEQAINLATSWASWTE